MREKARGEKEIEKAERKLLYKGTRGAGKWGQQGRGNACRAARDVTERRRAKEESRA